MDPIDADTRIIDDDDKEEETDFGGYYDDEELNQDRTIENESFYDESISAEEIQNNLDELLNSKSQEEEAKDFIKNVYDEVDFKKISVKKNGDLVFVSLKRKSGGVWFLVNEDGIQERYNKTPSKTLEKYLGKKKIDRVLEDTSKLTEEIDKKSNEKENIIKNQEELQNKNKTLEIQLRNAEERLDEYKKEIDSYKNYDDRNLHIEGRLKDTKKIREQVEHIEDLKNELEENIQKREELEEEIKNDYKLLEEVSLKLEIEQSKHEELFSKMSWKNKVKYIFKQHGFTIIGVLTAVASVISVIVSNLSSGLASVTNTLGNGLKALSKKVAQILPGMVGAIASFFFRTAGSVLGFLAKNSWLLILLVVTYAVEQYTKKK